MSFQKEIKDLESKNLELNDPKLIEKQHNKGKLTARERIESLFDIGSFCEIDAFAESRFQTGKDNYPGDGVITGFGKINKRTVYVYSQDFSAQGGSLGEMHAQKIIKIFDMAVKTGSPIVGIIDSGGARIQEGVYSLDGYGGIFRKIIKASGVVPQITVLLGPCAGGASYAPGLSDFVFMVQGTSTMFITGPDVVKKVTGEEVTGEDLGGAKTHGVKSGCAHMVFQSEQDCFSGVKQLLSYLPQNNLSDPPRQRSIIGEVFEKEISEKLLDIIPDNEKKGYDVKEIINEVFDKASFFEIQPDFAQNAITGFSRLSGYTVGVVANQPSVLAGCMDIDSSDKIARFVRLCDAFNIPIVNFVDTPGYLPGTDQEEKGIIRHGAKVLYAYAEATVPKISIILRKAFGGAYIAMCSKHLAYDAVIAWPAAQLAVMGPEQAVKIIYKRELAESKNPERLEQEKIQELKDKFLNPFVAAKAGQIDMIINPKETRESLFKIFESLLNKRELKVPKKHGNIPL
ncbi:MAG TPA: acyl-CoA carboxylase subunit beta [Candidatus Pacearchaeota archaeon]|nr:acyl-CoA carboxylase subunit beta [Candidatus Pacearchaeota archaeon]